jgi:DNA-binding transcriptional LysR family regulator
MHEVRRLAPFVRIETRQLDYAQVENALDTGQIDFAFGYLPGVEKTQHQRLFAERYVVIARADHPRLVARPAPAALAQLDYVVVRHHTETVRLLDRLALNDRIRLSTPHFMVIPAIVVATDLVVVLPLRIATKFAQDGRLRIVQPRWDVPDFDIGLHWSWRAQNDPANRWLRELAIDIFREGPAAAAATSPRKSASPRRPAGATRRRGTAAP